MAEWILNCKYCRIQNYLVSFLEALMFQILRLYYNHFLNWKGARAAFWRGFGELLLKSGKEVDCMKLIKNTHKLLDWFHFSPLVGGYMERLTLGN